MGINRITMVGLCGVVALGLVLCGCPRDGGEQAQEGPMGGMMPEASGPEAAGGAVTIQQKGSDTLLQVAQALAEAYGQQHPSIEVSVTGGGSGTGFQALIEGTTDMANASRAIDDKEVKEAKQKGVAPREHIVAYDGIAVVVHPSNPVDALSIEELSDMYTSQITNWSEVGGKDEEISLVSRNTASGTYEYFKQTVVQQGGEAEGRDYAASIIKVLSNTAVRQEVSENEAAIGYIGLGYVDDSVKAVDIVTDSGQKVSASQETVKDGSYPIARPLYMYTDGEPTGEVRNYLDWIMSEEGQRVVVSKDFVPAK